MRIIDVQQGSPEWHLARAGLATASHFGEILAKGRGGEEAVGRRNLRTRLVLERMTSRAITDGFDTFAIRQGREREPAAGLAYSVRTGTLIERVGFCRHNEILAGCSPDALIEDDPDGPGGLEIKSPEPSAHLAVLRSGRIPPVYVPQVQGSMWICGRSWWDFVSYSPDFPERLQLRIIRVRRDREYIDRLSAEARIFLAEVAAEAQELEQLES